LAVAISDGKHIVRLEFSQRSGQKRFAATKSFTVTVVGRPGASLPEESERGVRKLIDYMSLRDDGTLKVSELKEAKNEVAGSISADKRFAEAASDRQVYELRTLTSAEMTAIREVAASGRLEFFIQTRTECRRKCIFCNVTKEDKGAYADTSLVQFERNFIRLNREIGARKILFWSNEPLHHPELPNLIAEARESGFTEIIVQTGGAFDEDSADIEECAAAGLTRLQIPIYGATAETQDMITGSEGAFEETINGARRAVAAGVYVAFNTIVIRQNLHEIPDIADFIKTNFPGSTLSYSPFWARPGQEPDFPFFAPRFSEMIEVLRPRRASIAIPAPLCVRSDEIVPLELSKHTDYQLRSSNMLNNGELLSLNQGKPDEYGTHCRACAICETKPKCSGVYSLYLLHYGDDEFKPI